MQQEISIRAITHDPYLVALFQQLESTHETCVDNKFE